MKESIQQQQQKIEKQQILIMTTGRAEKSSNDFTHTMKSPTVMQPVSVERNDKQI